jgi:hypothetical protein
MDAHRGRWFPPRWSGSCLTLKYSLLADAIAFFHAVLTSLIFVPLLCRLLGCRIPFWLAVTCLSAATISTLSYAFLRDCFINPVEQHFRKLAHEETFAGSFVAHHIYRLTRLRLGRRSVFLILLLCGLSSGATVASHFIERPLPGGAASAR